MRSEAVEERPPHEKYAQLMARAAVVKSPKTIVVHPCDETSLRGALEAAEAELIEPVFVGPAAKIKAVAQKFGLDISRFEIVPAAHSEEAAEKGVQLIQEGKGEVLMKGSLHTDELMRSVTSKTSGLRTARRISHAFIMDVPTYKETLLITDAAINIFAERPRAGERAELDAPPVEPHQALGRRAGDARVGEVEVEHVRRRVDHAQRAVDVERVDVAARRPRTAATARPGTRRRRGCTPSRARPRRGSRPCRTPSAAARRRPSARRLVRHRRGAAAQAHVAPQASPRSRRCARTPRRRPRRPCRAAATNGVATSFTVWRRLSKMTSVSVRTMHSVGQVQVVGRARRQLLERAHHVVADPADGAAPEPRQPRRRATGRKSQQRSRRAPRRRIGAAHSARCVGAPPPSTSRQTTS